MLPQKRRVTKALFPEILKYGKNYSEQNISGKIIRVKNEIIEKKYGPQSRFSIVVPKSVSKKAAERNLLKRRGYSIIHKNIKALSNNHMVAIFFRKGAQTLKYKNLADEILNILKKSGVFK